MTKYQILDISNWERLRSGKGTSQTYWVIDPEIRRRALFKIPRYNKDKNFYAGGHWAEKIVSEIGKKLSIATAEIDLLVCDDLLGYVPAVYSRYIDRLVTKNNYEAIIKSINPDQNPNEILEIEFTGVMVASKIKELGTLN